MIMASLTSPTVIADFSCNRISEIDIFLDVHSVHASINNIRAMPPIPENMVKLDLLTQVTRWRKLALPATSCPETLNTAAKIIPDYVGKLKRKTTIARYHSHRQPSEPRSSGAECERWRCNHVLLSHRDANWMCTLRRFSWSYCQTR